jgi:hypothetical protein
MLPSRAIFGAGEAPGARKKDPSHATHQVDSTLLVTVGLTLLVGLVLTDHAGVAQTTPSGAAPDVGSVVLPRFDLPTQDTPPNFLGYGGKSVGNVVPNQPYVVLQKKSYPGFSGPQEWVKVAPLPKPGSPSKTLDDKIKASDSVGWVYYGQEGSKGNFAICDQPSCVGQNM